MHVRRTRSIADMTPATFSALKEGETHYFSFVQPDGGCAPVKVSIQRQGKQMLRLISVDYYGGSFDLISPAADRFRAEYTAYYQSKIGRNLFRALHIPGGKTCLCMSVLTEDVGEWLYKASRMILTPENLTHCAPEFQAALDRLS